MGDDVAGQGTETLPFATLGRAIEATRESRKGGQSDPRTIVLLEGVHFMGSSGALTLSPQDSNLLITNGGAPWSKEAWLSGGVLLDSTRYLWTPSAASEFDPARNVWQANLTTLLDKTGVSALFGLDPHVRYTRARWPNADAETAQWGYASFDRYNWSLPSDCVLEWLKPPPGSPPTFKYVDLSLPNNPSGVVKDDSSMQEYNTWGSGSGGVCETVWAGESYWCGNQSAGGWAEVDQECAIMGQLQIPVGLKYNGSYTLNMSEPLGPRLSKWANASGGIVRAWHSQSWAMHMFEVASHDVGSSTIVFNRGGQQGGRNWCRCDQCTYAAGWCTQNEKPPPPQPDTRLISGSWMVENIQQELDFPGEFFFNTSTGILYFKPNTTTTSPPTGNFTIPVLRQLITMKGTQQSPVTNVTIRGIGFRDGLETIMEEWGAPSGGDWALHRGGAVFIEGAKDVTIQDCVFRRLDANAVFLSKYTRNVIIERNEFAWLGDNAMATWGETKDYDATNGDQPRETVVRYNLIHEVGISEKQSAAWAQAKTCQTQLYGNIMFNMPRAAINFNDHMGGGDSVYNNVIFNTCRESGDHGPINSWDRMPFLTKVAGGTPSFTPAPITIRDNLIVANYGASQGVDNDDGSSWFDIRSNLFYSADGFKMDYGGHHSNFSDNLVIVFPYDGSNCINVADFKKGQGHSYYNNVCVSGAAEYAHSSGCGSPACVNKTRPRPDMNVIGHVAQCDPAYTRLFNNSYYSPSSNTSMECGGKLYSIPMLQKAFNNDWMAISQVLPDANTVLKLAQNKLSSWN